MAQDSLQVGCRGGHVQQPAVLHTCQSQCYTYCEAAASR